MRDESMDAKQAEALYYEALDAIAAGEPLRAIEACRASIALDPMLLDARHALIRAHQDAGQFDEGIAAALQLAALDPDDVLAYTSLSILYQRQGLIPEAEAAALKAKLLGWKLELRAGRPREQL